MPLLAKKASKCWVCEMGIAPGDKIEFHRGRAVHLGCKPMRRTP